MYVDHPKDKSKLTCLIYESGNLSDECKILGDFGNKYDKCRLTKDYRKEPATEKRFGINQEKIL